MPSFQATVVARLHLRGVNLVSRKALAAGVGLENTTKQPRLAPRGSGCDWAPDCASVASLRHSDRTKIDVAEAAMAFGRLHLTGRSPKSIMRSAKKIKLSGQRRLRDQ